MHPQVEDFKKSIKDLIQKKNRKFLVVVGPCSIFNEEETVELEEKLCSLQKELGDSIIIVMRAFVEKSRTSNDWKGFVYQPNLDLQEDIIEGIYRTKKLFSRLTLPLSCEVINPEIFYHLEKYLTIGFVGARTCQSSIHRTLVSDTTVPFGFKNPLDGNIAAAVNGVHVARNSHCILRGPVQKISTGNPNSFVVLRGSENNRLFKKEAIEKTLFLQKQQSIDTPILIDCSHGNARNKPHDQEDVFFHTVSQYCTWPNNILGVMLETNLYAGSSKVRKKYGVSFTDPCLGFEHTREILLKGCEKIYTMYHKGESNLPTFCEHSH